LFDYWNGVEALRNYSPLRVRERALGSDRVLRVSRSTIDPLANLIKVSFDVMLFESDRLVTRFIEDHSMRYFFPREMDELLTECGYEVVHRCPFLQSEAPLSAGDWNVGMVARARPVL